MPVARHRDGARPADANAVTGQLMLIATILLIVGLVLLLGGARFLVDAVSSLALTAGVPPIVVGLTVVAFGTSTPEVVINGIAAWRGETQLAFGNVIGSCAINIGFVLAVTAMICPLQVERSIVTREIPLLMLTVAVTTVLAADATLDRAPVNILGRGDGLVLLLLFCVFLYSIVRQAIDARHRRGGDPFIDEVQQSVQSGVVAPAAGRAGRSVGRDLSLMLVGFVGVAAGGRMVVVGATGIAHSLGVPEVVIGLTIVSFGTTLPELATCIYAARKGQSDLAIGNIVGSNLYNLLFIGGMVATIHPVPIPAGGGMDLAAAAGLSILLLPIAIRGGFRVTRSEGLCLAAVYLGYMIIRLSTVR